MSKVALCQVHEVAPGQIKQGSLASGRKLAIYNVAGELYVTDDVCTHGEASLSEDGILEGHIVECSWHNGRFDVRTGQACAMPCTDPVRSFPVTIEEGRVFVESDT